MTFGEALYAQRKTRGWTQQETAGKLGISQQLYSKYEHDIFGEVPLSKLRKLSAVLGISLTTLITLLDAKEEKETMHA